MTEAQFTEIKRRLETIERMLRCTPSTINNGYPLCQRCMTRHAQYGVCPAQLKVRSQK